MSDPFDITQYPEDVRHLVQQAAQQYQEAQQSAARFQGIDADPDTLRRALRFHGDYTDPVKGPEMRAAMARQWGILNEGQSLDDLKAVNEQIAAYNAAQGQQFDFSDPDAVDPQQFIQALDTRYATPDQIQAKIAELEQKVMSEQERREQEADLMALEQQERALWKNLEGSGTEVSDFDKATVRALVKDRLMGDQVNGNNFHTVVEDAWEAYRQGVDARAKELMKQQQAKPRTTTQPSATPGATTPVTDEKSALKYVEEVIMSGLG